MANTADTPNIHLAYSDDADVNRNWEILDNAIKALGLRTIIPDNVLIQGDLEVTGNALIDGTLTATAGIVTSDLAATNVSVQTLLAHDLAVQGTVTLPAGAVAGSALAPGAAVKGVWVGTAIGTSLTLTGTPQKLAEVLTDATEDPNRWSLTIAQVTLTVSFGSPGGAPIADIDLDLHRGAVTMQTRELFWSASNMGNVAGFGLDIPVTVVRLSKPLDTSNAWSIWGSGSISGGAVASRTFAQVHTIQFT